MYDKQKREVKMSEDAQTPENSEEEEMQYPPVMIVGQYIKDLSFEIPNAPSIFETETEDAPTLDISVNVNATKMREDAKVFEVTLDFHIASELVDQKAFILEISYAGVFALNVPEEAEEPVLMIECARMLFPYVRSIISSITSESGFPPVVLAPFDFAGFYQQRLEATEDGSEESVN